jgi:hypothetical protein
VLLADHGEGLNDHGEEEQQPPVTPMEGCAERVRPDASMLERVRRRLTVTACASSAWLDSLFGDQFRYDQYRSTYGTISAGGLWSDYDGFDPRLRFLDLGGTAATDAHARALARWQALEILHLDDTAVTDAGAKALAGAPALTTVRLDGTSIGDETLVAFAAQLRLLELGLL